jgi:hypothetical protein
MDEPIIEQPKVDALAQYRNEKGQFIQGKPPGPGRPQGSKDFKTLFDEAIVKITQETNLPEIETRMIVRAVEKALSGDYKFFKDLMDRKYGKATEHVEIGVEKEKLDELGDFLRKLAKPQNND